VALQVVLCHLAENDLAGLGLDVQLVQLSTHFVDRFRQLFPSGGHPLARHHLNRLGMLFFLHFFMTRWHFLVVLVERPPSPLLQLCGSALFEREEDVFGGEEAVEEGRSSIIHLQQQYVFKYNGYR